ncbi:MAG: hypothetical protein QXY49_01165 [Thermofilaceae archaeon]
MKRSFAKLLAGRIGAQACTTVKGVEVDLALNSDACEVKLYPAKFHSGFDQALALKHVAGFESVCLLHIVKSLGDGYLEGITKLCRATGISVLVYSEVSGVHVFRG